MILQDYRFTIEYKKGALNDVPEALSRIYEGEEGPVLAVISWVASTKDEWNLRLLREVTEEHTRYPRMKVVPGQRSAGR